MTLSDPSIYSGLITVKGSGIGIFTKVTLTSEHEQRLSDHLVPEHARHLIPINRRDNTLLELLFGEYNTMLQAAGADETRKAHLQDVKEVECAYVITQDEPHFHVKILAYLINGLWYDAATHPFPETLDGRAVPIPAQLHLWDEVHAFQEQILASRYPEDPHGNEDQTAEQALEQRLNTLTWDILDPFHQLCQKLPTLPSGKHPTEPFPTLPELKLLLSYLPPVSKIFPRLQVQLDGNDWYAVVALGLWRLTRGVYDLHPPLLDSLWEATTPLNLPLLDPSPRMDPTVHALAIVADPEQRKALKFESEWLKIPSLLALFPFPKLPERAIYIRLPGRFDGDGLPLYGVFVTFPPRGVLLVLDGAHGAETLLLDAQLGTLAAAIEHEAQVRREPESQVAYAVLLNRVMNVVLYLCCANTAPPQRSHSTITLEGSLQRGSFQETTFWEINPVVPEAGAPAAVNTSPFSLSDPRNASLSQPGYFEMLYGDPSLEDELEMLYGDLPPDDELEMLYRNLMQPGDEASFQLRWHPPEGKS